MIDLPFEHVFGELDATGAILRDVLVCAFTGRPDAPVMIGVPGTRLFYRLSGLAARTL